MAVEIPGEVFLRWSSLGPNAARLLIDAYRIAGESIGSEVAFRLNRSRLSYVISGNTFYRTKAALIRAGFLRRVRSGQTNKPIPGYVRFADHA